MRKTLLPDAAESWPPVTWKASWIWAAEATTGHHDYVYFRRELRLDAVPAMVLIRLAAERDATLWVNGKLIAHGPPISDPRFKRFETHDITAHLVPGANCIAVRVYHDMGIGGFTAHADARGLLAQVEADGEVILATDGSWRALPAKAYAKSAPRMGDSCWAEVFNAKLDFPHWKEAGFDDSGWGKAFQIIPDTHALWGAAQPQARFYPWVNLIPSETRPLKRTRHRPAAILAMGEVLQQREASSHDVAIRMSLERILPLEKAHVENPDALLGNGTVIIRNSALTESYDTFDGLRNVTLVLDFGRLMNARFGFRLRTDAATVDIGYAYRLEEGRVIPYVSTRTAIADQYTARSGEQAWETADWRHFRYVQLTFRELPGELELSEVWAEEVQNHFAPRGAFTCSDPKLERIFDLVRRTVELSCVDRTMDNPSRERKQYIGDCSAIVPAITSCFGDAALLRRYFANVREGQHATGHYRYSYPGHDDDRASLFDHALSVPLRLWEHYQLFADLELVQHMWPGLRQFLELAASCLDDEAMMTLPPYNIWFDWGHMDRRGYFLPLQAMTAEALRCAAELANAIGESPDPWAGLAQRMIGNVPRWFDDRRGVFVDAIVDGERQSHISEHAMSLVAGWQLAPDEMIRRTLDCWAADPLAFGQTSPAWNYLPGAFLLAGRPELAIRWLHQRLNQIDSQGLDTWPETWCLFGERTLGTWRCRNSRAVAQGAGLGATTALLQGLCGIQPGEPGFASVRLAPQPGPLASLSGTVPGPDGEYTLSLEKTDSGWRLELSLPSPRRVTLNTRFVPDIKYVCVNGETIPVDATGEIAFASGLQSSLYLETPQPYR